MGIESLSAVVRWPDLRAAGFDTRAVRRALRAGSLQRLARGLYATASPASQRPYQDLREVAARLDGVICGTTAARLHGIELARSRRPFTSASSGDVGCAACCPASKCTAPRSPPVMSNSSAACRSPR